MYEIWQSLSIYISSLSINQHGKVTKVSELGGGSLKASKMTNIKYKTLDTFIAILGNKI